MRPSLLVRTGAEASISSSKLCWPKARTAPHQFELPPIHCDFYRCVESYVTDFAKKTAAEVYNSGA
eukprot:scaffold2663_cov256-Pinguiococcus_pyrenoidosus.AAC.18